MDKFQIPGADDIAELRVFIESLDLTGHAAKGWIFADPEDPNTASAKFTYVPGHDRYDVVPFPTRPWADKHTLGGSGYNLAAAMRIVQKWVEESKQKTEV